MYQLSEENKGAWVERVLRSYKLRGTLALTIAVMLDKDGSL